VTTPDLEAILCAADLKKVEGVSAYGVPKPSVGTESDVSVRKCVLGYVMNMLAWVVS